jgi:hypothetical protein
MGDRIMKPAKRIFTLISVAILAGITGCLTFQKMRVEIHFKRDYQQGEITVTYTGIGTSESDKDRQMSDFEDLREAVEEDNFYLDALEDGIYVKEIQLKKVDGQIVGNYTGIFRNLRIDGKQLLVNENDCSLEIAKEEGYKIRSNGKVTEEADKFTVVWPKSDSSMWYEITCSPDQPVYSLLPYFDSWQKGKNE